MSRRECNEPQRVPEIIKGMREKNEPNEVFDIVENKQGSLV